MKTITLTFATLSLITMSACQNLDNNKNEPSAISAESITVHDEIMPQISIFDKHTVLIDSLLEDLENLQNQHPSLDTLEVRTELSTLKIDLESATDRMMMWMKNYAPDSADTGYQKAQLDSITHLKGTFEEVSENAVRLLTPYNN